MDEQQPLPWHYNPQWASPHRLHMTSWDQASFPDDQAYRLASTTNTPQRLVNGDNDTDNAQPSLSPYPVGPNHPQGHVGMDPSYETPYPFAEFPPVVTSYSHQSLVPIPGQDRRIYEVFEPDITPPPKVERRSFDIIPSRAEEQGQVVFAGASKRVKITHQSSSNQGPVSANEERNRDEKAPVFYRTAVDTTAPNGFQPTSLPYPSSVAGSTQPSHLLYAAAKTFVLCDDNVLCNQKHDESVSPIKKQPALSKLQAQSAPPKQKRPKRSASKRPSPLKQNAPKPISLSPSKEEIAESSNPRAREALETWYKRLGDLYVYKQVHGHCNVPQKYNPNPSLGTWVNKQRMEYKAYTEGKKNSMTERKFEALRKLEFDWGKRKGETAWENKFNELHEYKIYHDDCTFVSLAFSLLTLPLAMY